MKEEIKDKWVKALRSGEYNIGEPIDFDVETGDIIYVVWVQWNEGDSYKRYMNNRFETVAIFKTEKKLKNFR